MARFKTSHTLEVTSQRLKLKFHFEQFGKTSHLFPAGMGGLVVGGGGGGIPGRASVGRAGWPASMHVYGRTAMSQTHHSQPNFVPKMNLVIFDF